MAAASSSSDTDRLTQIYEANDLPSGARLLKLARQQGLSVTRKEVDRFLAAQAERQVFRSQKKDPFPGAFHAAKPQAKWLLDLIDMSKRPADPNGGFRFILAAQDVYTRKLYLEPLVGKDPENLLGGYRRIERRAGASPAVLTSDKEGGILAPPFQDHLDSKNTIFRKKRALNDTAPLDSLILQVRKRLAQLRVREKLPANTCREEQYR